MQQGEIRHFYGEQLAIVKYGKGCPNIFNLREVSQVRAIQMKNLALGRLVLLCSGKQN